ncbi:hypothetical protein KIH39_26430 [Telmatocola sphagniphila]|uniref:Uncharacterized protein n=1 Tax=Telmatocola sphagniphila TaxID=1123043 RepID=A0A8E6B6L7_9BACT|nr:hypothetical protein [Telmatocola sphagniphila]QVL32327.1 hypothetical protein KIH39_26430 [Telmatocola sphagniphila]
MTRLPPPDICWYEFLLNPFDGKGRLTLGEKIVCVNAVIQYDREQDMIDRLLDELCGPVTKDRTLTERN